jgi:DNA mismatch repair protein MutS2
LTLAPPVPNLLHAEPGLCLDLPALSQALTFAFATGGTGETFSRILCRSKLAASAFHPESFVKDLFVADFVARCLTVRIGERGQSLHRPQLVRELSQPPSDPRVTELRQRVLRELDEQPLLERGAQRAFEKIRELMLLLEAADRGKRYDAIGRRLEILRALKDTLEVTASAFESAHTELRRAHEFSQAVIQSPAFQALSDLLDYEGNLATLDLRIRVSHDGQLRSFEIVRAQENRKNPFYLSPWKRLLSRVKMLFRGYRFREAELLGQLANRVFDGLHDAVVGLFQLGLHLEFYLAALSLRDRAREAGLGVCLPELVPTENHRGARSELGGLFNPLLLLEARPPRPANIDVSAEGLVIITGPNSGGKTRLLQALGLTQLLAQAGLFVPATRARLAARDGLFVSLIQEATADQPEGHLGMELLRIRRLFEDLSPNSLVVMDELCSGTNPSEGEEIFRLVVDLLAELEPQAFITTHFLRFAADLERERPLARLEFLQVELDAQHEPTYGFVPGVAGTSLAGKTAERLGVTREALAALVESKRRFSPAQNSELTSVLSCASSPTVKPA